MLVQLNYSWLHSRKFTLNTVKEAQIQISPPTGKDPEGNRIDLGICLH